MSAATGPLRGRAGLAALAGLGLIAAVVFAATSDSGDGATGRATDSWGALAPSPLERTEVGAARIGDRIYVVGGFISTGGTTGKMVAYDISGDRWLRRRSLPIAVNHPGVTALDGRLYVLGGDLSRHGEPAKSKRLYRYSPRHDEWTRLPNAPTARGALGLVGIGRRLYAAGGYSLSDDTLTTLEIFDTKKKRWTTGAEMPTGRNHVGAAVLDGDLVVTGGRPGPVNGGLTTVERYQPRVDAWLTMPPLTTARSGHATVAVAGKLVAFGGEELNGGGTTIEQVELYDPATDSWSALPEMITPRHGLGAAAKGKRVFALEGGPQPGLAFSNALEFLDLP